MRIRKVNRFSKKVFDAVCSLLPQLTPGPNNLSEEKFRKIISSGNIKFFISETDKREIAGMLTIAVYRTVTGPKYWIEDVVVDEKQRGKGYGKELLLHAINFARESGAKSLELTSRPTRIEANRLYRDLGFELRETNVYRYLIK